MSVDADAEEALEKLPDIVIRATGLDLYALKALKGKFVVTQSGKFFCRLFPKEEFDGSKYFHNNILEELGVADGTTAGVKGLMAGGGKIEVEMREDYVECRLYGKSTNYGPYGPDDIDTGKLETALQAYFDLGMLPVLVIPDFEV